MNRVQLEHVIRAAGAIAEENDLIIIGSQAILAAVPNPPAELVHSMEVDSKLLAGRPKDWAFVRAMVKHGITNPESLVACAEELKGASREQVIEAVRAL